MTFGPLGDGGILAAGSIAARGVCVIDFSTTIDDITGLRLEAIEDPSLPGGNGPGLHVANGNFLLTEMQFDSIVVPEPSTTLLILCGLAGLARESRSEVMDDTRSGGGARPRARGDDRHRRFHF